MNSEQIYQSRKLIRYDVFYVYENLNGNDGSGSVSMVSYLDEDEARFIYDTMLAGVSSKEEGPVKILFLEKSQFGSSEILEVWNRPNWEIPAHYEHLREK